MSIFEYIHVKTLLGSLLSQGVKKSNITSMKNTVIMPCLP